MKQRAMSALCKMAMGGTMMLNQDQREKSSLMSVLIELCSVTGGAHENNREVLQFWGGGCGPI